MNYKYSCVIDAAGYYKTYVLIQSEPNGNGVLEDKMIEYDLKEGEQLLDAYAPSEFVKARWTGTEWEECATPEEIEEWKKRYPTPPPLEATPEQKRLFALEEQVTDTQLALAGVHENTDRQITDLMLSQAESYEQTGAQNTDMLLATAEVYEKQLVLEERIAAE